MQILILLAVIGAEPSWQLQTIDLINVARAEANLRELAIHGDILHFREPLVYDARCQRAAQWGCDALKGSKYFDHIGYVNRSGFLIDPISGRQISRVWLPTYQPDGFTNWGYRLKYLGVEDWWLSSENGGLFSRPTPQTIVLGWTRSGWHDDPRQARFHYGNLIQPLWTKAGLGKNGWGRGLDSVFCDFLAD